MMRIKCSHDLYGGHAIADKWYDVIKVQGGLYWFVTEKGLKLNAIPYGYCAFLQKIPGAFWTVEE